MTNNNTSEVPNLYRSLGYTGLAYFLVKKVAKKNLLKQIDGGPEAPGIPDFFEKKSYHGVFSIFHLA